MTITITPPESATQRARWDSADGKAWAAVNRQGVVDDRGAQGFAWELAGPSERANVGFHYTEAQPAGLIYGWGDVREMLSTLASFVSAWAEAIERPGSDNRDLFPASVVGFVDYADEFSAAMFVEPEVEQ